MDINKIIAKLPVGFADEAAGMDGERLRAEIIRAETSLHEVEREVKGDEKLQAARQVVKDMVSSYNEVKRAQRAKIAYALCLLEERGELGVGELGERDAVTRSEPAARKPRSAKAA